MSLDRVNYSSPDKENMSHVPVLEVNGSNWIVFQHRLTRAFASHRVLCHLTGESARPTSYKSLVQSNPLVSPPTSTAGPMSATSGATLGVSISSAGVLPTPSPIPPSTSTLSPAQEQYILLQYQEQWDNREDKARDMLERVVPDSVALQLHPYATTAEAWKYLVTTYGSRMESLQVEYKEELESYRMENGGNVNDHIVKLRYRRERLACAGKVIPDAEWCAIVVKSLSKTTWSQWAKTMLSAGKMYGHSIPDSETFINILCQEYDSVKWNVKMKKGTNLVDSALIAANTDDTPTSSSSSRST